MVTFPQRKDSSFLSTEHSKVRTTYKQFPINCHKSNTLLNTAASLPRGTFLLLLWFVNIGNESSDARFRDSSTVVSIVTESR